jgi:hypothetical protein
MADRPMASFWTSWDLPPAYWWVFTYLAAASYLVVAAVSIWAALSRRHWFARVAVVGSVLALTLPIGAYDLFLLFLTQAVVCVLVCLFLRWATDHAAVMEPPSKDWVSLARAGIRRLRSSPPRFTVTDLLLVTVVVAGAAAVLARVPTWMWGLSNVLFLLGSSMAISSIIAITCHRRIGGGWSRWHARVLTILRLLLLVASVPMLGFALMYFVFFAPRTLMARLFHPSGWSLVVALAANIALAIWFRLVPWRSVAMAARSDLQVMPDTVRQLQRPKVATLAAGALACLLIGPLAYVYLLLAWPRSKPDVTFSRPNGYDELLVVGKELYDVDLLSDVDRAALDELQSFWSEHGSKVARIRQALDSPFIPTVRYAEDDTNGWRTLSVNGAGRAFHAAARLAELEGRTHDALRWSIDHARLSLATSQGEVSKTELLVTRSIDFRATSSIHALADSMGPKSCRESLAELLEMEARREPLEDYHQRYHDWMDVAAGWQGRLLNFLNDTVGVDDMHNEQQQFNRAWRRNVAFRRLLLCRLALRIHQPDHGRLPDTLAELTPDYLPAVPDDPFGTGWLTYHRKGDTYRLYSLGHDRRDDGGAVLAVRPDDSGDLFLPPDGKWPW